MMIILSRGLKGRVLTKLKIHQFHQNQSNVWRRRGRNIFIFAAMKDVPTKLSVEEYVADMVPKLRLVAMKDVPIRHLREEGVRSTVNILAVMRDVPIIFLMEESVLDMVPRGKLAVMKDVPNRYRKEEYVGNMGQKLRVMTDVPMLS